MNRTELLKIKKNFKYTPSISAIEIKKNIYLEFDNSNFHHKEKIDLGNKSKKNWIKHITQTINLLEENTPQNYSKIKDFINCIVPYGYEKGIQKSLSYTNCPGVLYLSFQNNPITQAEAIIHETNHSILFLFSQLNQGILNPYEAKYYSAAQNKPREIHNCFLAFHAFVHVLEYYLELIKNTQNSTQITQTIFSTYLKSISLQGIISKYASFTKRGEKLFNQLKNIIKINENNINKLKKIYFNEFENAQEEEFTHFKQVIDNFKNIEF